MAARRAATGGQQQTAQAEMDWAKASRDDMIVRSVLDNEIGLLLRQTREQNKHIQSLYMMDGAGTLIAASDKLPTLYQNENDWWALLRSASGDRVASEGAVANDILGLMLPRMSPGGSVLAAVRAEISLPALINDLVAGGALKSGDNQVAVMLIADAALAVTPSPPASVTAFGPTLASRINNIGQATGWYQGFRFRGQALDAGLYWARPVWIVAVHQEGRLSPAIIVPLAIALLTAFLAVFGVTFFAKNVGRRQFLDPMRDAAEAGVWVLRRAGGKLEGLVPAATPAQPESEGLAAAHPWANMPYDESSPLHRELDRWMTRLQQRAEGDATQLSADMQNDLRLATEFQQALMNRKLPSIPAVYTEGRLRLEFSHAYKAALAIGGDFFEVEAVGPDCAGVFIGDVMGHGTRSALLTSTIRTLLSEHYPAGRNPAHFLRELNRSLCEILAPLPFQFFASACYFAVDTTARIGTYAIAGHPPPFHLHGHLGRISRLERPRPRGAALGVMIDEEFGAESVRLVDGDTFVLFTDGAYETTNEDGEQFGLDRLEKSLRSHVYERPDALVQKVLADIVAFAGDEPVADDICLVAVHVTSKGPEQPREKAREKS
jgi:serine phosphatase RsbU (regulator of sigma subunit)